MKFLIVLIVFIAAMSFSQTVNAVPQMRRPSQVNSDFALTRPSHVFSRGIYKPRIFPTY